MSPSGTGAADQPAVRLGWRQASLLAAVVAGLFAAYLSAELAQNRVLGFPLDDSWIHLTFARNLARGWGLAYNLGDPVAGSTAPLWTLILAFFHLFTRGATAMVVIAKLLGAALLFASAVFAFRIAARLTESEWAGLAAGLAVATLGPMGWAMMSGMEVTLSVALTLAAIYYYFRFRTGWASTLPWILFGLAAWARPESLLLAPLAAIDSVVRRLVLKQRFTFWRGLGVWLAIALAWLGFNYSLSGSPFPQTYLIKASKVSLFTAIGLGSLRQIKGLLTIGAGSYFAEFGVHIWQANPVFCLLVPVGLVGLVVSAFRRGRHGLLVPLVVLGYVPLIGVVSPSFGAAFQSGRYIGNATALAAVVAVVGFAYVRRVVRGRRLRLVATAALLGLATFNTLTVSAATLRNTTKAESCVNRMQVALGRWLGGNTPTDATIACNDVGAIGYFADRRVFDLTGLVTKEFLGYRLDRQGFMAFFRKYRPDYLAIFPASYPGLRNAPYIKAVARADVPDNIISLLNFKPHARTIAGVLTLDVSYRPVPVIMAVFECDWNLLPSAQPGAR